jgi:hypothetical protein
MTDEKRIVHRGTWWPERVVPLVAFGFAMLMGWGPSVAIGAALAAALIAAFVRPRGPGR